MFYDQQYSHFVKKHVIVIVAIVVFVIFACFLSLLSHCVIYLVSFQWIDIIYIITIYLDNLHV